MTRRPPFGTAHKEVLARMGTLGKPWNDFNGAALYENRALTKAVCEGLVLHGFLSKTVQDSKVTVYTLTPAGRRKAEEIQAMSRAW